MSQIMLEYTLTSKTYSIPYGYQLDLDFLRFCDNYRKEVKNLRCSPPHSTHVSSPYCTSNRTFYAPKNWPILSSTDNFSDYANGIKKIKYVEQNEKGITLPSHIYTSSETTNMNRQQSRSETPPTLNKSNKEYLPYRSKSAVIDSLNQVIYDFESTLEKSKTQHVNSDGKTRVVRNRNEKIKQNHPFNSELLKLNINCNKKNNNFLSEKLDGSNRFNTIYKNNLFSGKKIAADNTNCKTVSGKQIIHSKRMSYDDNNKYNLLDYSKNIDTVDRSPNKCSSINEFSSCVKNNLTNSNDKQDLVGIKRDNPIITKFDMIDKTQHLQSIRTTTYDEQINKPTVHNETTSKITYNKPTSKINILDKPNASTCNEIKNIYNENDSINFATIGVMTEDKLIHNYCKIYLKNNFTDFIDMFAKYGKHSNKNTTNDETNKEYYKNKLTRGKLDEINIGEKIADKTINNWLSDNYSQAIMRSNRTVPKLKTPLQSVHLIHVCTQVTECELGVNYSRGAFSYATSHDASTQAGSPSIEICSEASNCEDDSHMPDTEQAAILGLSVGTQCAAIMCEKGVSVYLDVESQLLTKRELQPAVRNSASQICPETRSRSTATDPQPVLVTRANKSTCTKSVLKQNSSSQTSGVLTFTRCCQTETVKNICKRSQSLNNRGLTSRIPVSANTVTRSSQSPRNYSWSRQNSCPLYLNQGVIRARQGRKMTIKNSYTIENHDRPAHQTVDMWLKKQSSRRAADITSLSSQCMSPSSTIASTYGVKTSQDECSLK